MYPPDLRSSHSSSDSDAKPDRRTTETRGILYKSVGTAIRSSLTTQIVRRRMCVISDGLMDVNANANSDTKAAERGKMPGISNSAILILRAPTGKSDETAMRTVAKEMTDDERETDAEMGREKERGKANETDREMAMVDGSVQIVNGSDFFARRVSSDYCSYFVFCYCSICVL